MSSQQSQSSQQSTTVRKRRRIPLTEFSGTYSNSAAQESTAASKNSSIAKSKLPNGNDALAGASSKATTAGQKQSDSGSSSVDKRRTSKEDLDASKVNGKQDQQIRKQENGTVSLLKSRRAAGSQSSRLSRQPSSSAASKSRRAAASTSTVPVDSSEDSSSDDSSSEDDEDEDVDIEQPRRLPSAASSSTSTGSKDSNDETSRQRRIELFGFDPHAVSRRSERGVKKVMRDAKQESKAMQKRMTAAEAAAKGKPISLDSKKKSSRSSARGSVSSSVATPELEETPESLDVDAAKRGPNHLQAFLHSEDEDDDDDSDSDNQSTTASTAPARPVRRRSVSWKKRRHGRSSFAAAALPKRTLLRNMKKPLSRKPRSRPVEEVDADEDEQEEGTEALRASSVTAAGPLRPSFYNFLKKNVYISKIPYLFEQDETPICQCDRNGTCDENCINRSMNIECDPKLCPCGERCTNNRFQKRRYAKVEVKAAGMKGFGLYAKQDIKEGDFVMEYCGEVLDQAALSTRIDQFEVEGRRHFYFLNIDADTTIDATLKGNKCRFMNHSCDPNCETKKWIVERHHRVGLFAIKDIAKGEELTFDYAFERYGRQSQKCYCGAAACRGVIRAKPREADVIQRSQGEIERDNERKRVARIYSTSRLAIKTLLSFLPPKIFPAHHFKDPTDLKLYDFSLNLGPHTYGGFQTSVHYTENYYQERQSEVRDAAISGKVFLLRNLRSGVQALTAKYHRLEKTVRQEAKKLKQERESQIATTAIRDLAGKFNKNGGATSPVEVAAKAAVESPTMDGITLEALGIRRSKIKAMNSFTATPMQRLDGAAWPGKGKKSLAKKAAEAKKVEKNNQERRSSISSVDSEDSSVVTKKRAPAGKKRAREVESSSDSEGSSSEDENEDDSSDDSSDSDRKPKKGDVKISKSKAQPKTKKARKVVDSSDSDSSDDEESESRSRKSKKPSQQPGKKKSTVTKIEAKAAPPPVSTRRKRIRLDSKRVDTPASVTARAPAKKNVTEESSSEGEPDSSSSEEEVVPRRKRTRLSPGTPLPEQDLLALGIRSTTLKKFI